MPKKTQPKPQRVKEDVKEDVVDVVVPKEEVCDKCRRPLPESYIPKNGKRACTLACANSL